MATLPEPARLITAIRKDTGKVVQATLRDEFIERITPLLPTAEDRKQAAERFDKRAKTTSDFDKAAAYRSIAHKLRSS